MCGLHCFSKLLPALWFARVCFAEALARFVVCGRSQTINQSPARVWCVVVVFFSFFPRLLPGLWFVLFSRLLRGLWFVLFPQSPARFVVSPDFLNKDIVAIKHVCSTSITPSKKKFEKHMCFLHVGIQTFMSAVL